MVIVVVGSVCDLLLFEFVREKGIDFIPNTDFKNAQANRTTEKHSLGFSSRILVAPKCNGVPRKNEEEHSKMNEEIYFF